MAVERFIWTTHAEDRRSRRLIDRSAVEHTISTQHADREINAGDADWRVRGLLPDGRRFIVVYDHPANRDTKSVAIVSVWDL